MIMTELRKHPRIKCRLIVDRLGPTTDMSAGGLRVLTANPQPEGSEVRLAFQLPESEETVQCHGSVMHVTQSTIDKDLFEVGIQYQRMMTRNREAIEAYVRERVEDAAED
jgi:Tfp pilus assembly protein PilZ